MTLKDFFTWGRKQVDIPFVTYFGQKYQGLLGSVRGRKYLEEYRGWVFACVQARSEEVGNINLKLIKGDEEVVEGELLDILFKVNPTMTKEDLFSGTQAYLDLDGNAFWFLARENDGKGKIAEIWLLRPDKMGIVPDETNPLAVKGYVYHQPDGKKVPFEPNQILHFKNFNPLGDHPFPHRGIGIVEAASWSIDTDNESRQWNYSFFKNSARPDGFLVKEGTGSLSAEDYKRLKEQFNQEHEGTLNAHKVAILSGGVKWQDMTRSQKDMDFIEQRRLSRDEILALFRVPKSVIGIVEDVNRSNAEASNYIFALRTVKPLMEKIIGTLNEFLVPEFGEDLWLDFESPVPEDRTQKIAEYTAGIDRWMTRNEIRMIEGLPPSENGNQIFGPLANIPIDSVPEQKKMPKPSAKRKEKKSIVEEFISKMPPEEKPERKLSELAIKNYTEIWLKAFSVEVDPLKKQLDEFFEKQKKEVLENIKEELKGLEVKEYKLKAAIDFLFDKPKAIGSTIALMTPAIRRFVKQSGDQATLLVGAAAFDATNPRALAFIEERVELFADTFNDTTTRRLLVEINAGLEADETIDQMSERVSQFYKGEEDFRSEVAARTEVSAASNFGAEEAYKQAGVTKMQWLVVNPEDEDCLSNADEVRDIGDDFPSGDERPPVHPNCVCTLLPSFE